jgi:asparagine synthase (glutamine-hydrolysing)
MSAICGIYKRRGGVPDRHRLDRIGRDLRAMGPDRVEREWMPRVAMSFHAFDTDELSCEGRGVLVTRTGDMIAVDGRLDNLEDVVCALPAAEQRPVAAPHALLALYRAFGIDGLRHAIGDFAFALWDEARRRLVLGCDAMGRRPLYYACSTDDVLWASRARALSAALTSSPELDFEFVADFMANRPSLAGPFRGISRVPGAHVLVADADGARLQRYYDFDAIERIRYRRDADYEDHFRELLRASVACRLPSSAPVYCELSGGLDSSAIACVAADVIRRRSGTTGQLRTVSYLYDRSPESDESDFVRLVEDELQGTHLHLWESDHPLVGGLPAGFVPDAPTIGLCHVNRTDALTRQMTAASSRVLLSGMGGDHLFWSQVGQPGPLVADHLAQGRLVHFVRDSLEWSRLLRVSFPAVVADGVRRVVSSSAGTEASPIGTWFHPQFVRSTNLCDRMRPPAVELRFELPSQRAQYHDIWWAARPFALEPCSSAGYIDRRYPFLDRRMAEFSLGVPIDQKVRFGESRSIVRRSLAGIVPDGVLQRRTKKSPGEALQRGLNDNWTSVSHLLGDSRVAAYGVVDVVTFRSELQRARLGHAPLSSQLFRTLALELWLRTLEPAGSMTDPPVPPGSAVPPAPPGSAATCEGVCHV